MNAFYLTLLIGLTLTPLTLTESCNGSQDEKKLEPPAAHNNIVLIGATGDLAQKYLWKGEKNACPLLPTK